MTDQEGLSNSRKVEYDQIFPEGEDSSISITSPSISQREETVRPQSTDIMNTSDSSNSVKCDSNRTVISNNIAANADNRNSVPVNSSIPHDNSHNNAESVTRIPNSQTGAPYMVMYAKATMNSPYENTDPNEGDQGDRRLYKDTYPGGLVPNGVQSNDTLTFKEIDDTPDVQVKDGTEESEGEDAPKKWTTKQKLTVFTFALANLGCTCCYSLLAPFFPDEAEKKGSTKLTTGLIFGCFEFVIFLTSPILGALLTRIGSRFMYCSGIMIAGCCAILFGFLDGSPPGSVYVGMCFAVRIVEATGCSMYIVASWAIIAHSFPDEISTLMGTLETFSGIGMMVGPALGGALYSLGGFKLPFLVMGPVLILIGIASALLLPPQDDVPSERKGVVKLLKIPSVLLSLITIIVAAFGLGYIDPTLAQHLEKVDPSLKSKYWLIGLIFLASPAVYAFTAPLWGHIADKTKRTKTMMIIGMLIGGLGFILMGPWQPIRYLFPDQKVSLWIVIVGLIVMAIGIGGTLIPVFSDLFEEISYHGFPDNFETKGLVSGVTNSAFSLGACLGPTVGGLLTNYLPFELTASITGMMCWSVAVLYLVYAIIYYGVMGGRKKAPGGSDEESQSLLTPDSVVRYDNGAVNTC